MKTRSVSYLPSLTALVQRLRTLVYHPILPAANGNKPLPTLASDWSGDSLFSLKSSLKDKPTDMAPKSMLPG